MKKKKAKSNSERKYDTISITMELERPLLYNEKDNMENTKDYTIKTTKQKKISKKSELIGILVIVLLLVIGFFVWMTNGYTLDNNYKEYLKSDNKVEVKVDGKYTYYMPKSFTATKGFIFYPGERVDASSYAKLCHMIASYGYEVVAVDMPFNYPAFGKNKAEEIIENNSNVKDWVIGGDSLGGSIASKYAIDNVKIKGIVLISSYTEENIRDSGLKVLSLWGSKDNIVDYKKLINSKAKLPRDTKYIEIEGANHSQFANYGVYSGDGEALISPDKQMDITVKKIINFLYSI